MRLSVEQQGKLTLALLAIALYMSRSDTFPLSGEALWPAFRALLHYFRTLASRTDAQEEERQVAYWLKQNPWKQDYFLHVIARLREVQQRRQEEFAFLRAYVGSDRRAQQEIYMQLTRTVVVNAPVRFTTTECHRLYSILYTVLRDDCFVSQW